MLCILIKLFGQLEVQNKICNLVMHILKAVVFSLITLLPIRRLRLGGKQKTLRTSKNDGVVICDALMCNKRHDRTSNQPK